MGRALRLYWVLQVLFILCFAIKGAGQVRYADIGVDGLTCSQCTRTVEESLRKLPFVAGVRMDLEHTSGRVILQPRADMEQVADAVARAGFSVRYIYITLPAGHPAPQGMCWQVAGKLYQFVVAPGIPAADSVRVQLLGRKYMPPREYKKVRSQLQPGCAGPAQPDFYVSLLKT